MPRPALKEAAVFSALLGKFHSVFSYQCYRLGVSPVVTIATKTLSVPTPLVAEHLSVPVAVASWEMASTVKILTNVSLIDMTAPLMRCASTQRAVSIVRNARLQTVLD